MIGLAMTTTGPPSPNGLPPASGCDGPQAARPALASYAVSSMNNSVRMRWFNRVLRVLWPERDG